MQSFMKFLSKTPYVNTIQLYLFLLLYFLILFCDIYTPLGYAEWLLYLLPTIGFFRITRFELKLFTVLATVLIIIGFFLSGRGLVPVEIALFNRSLMIAVLWAVFVMRGKYIRLERDLMNRNQQLESFLNNINDATVIFDKSGTVIKMNNAAKARYPQTKEGSPIETVHNGIECYDLQHNRVPRESLPAFRAVRGESVNQVKLLLKSKEWQDEHKYIEVNSSPIYMEDNLESVIITHHDITHLVEMQNEIREQHEKIIMLQNKRNDELEKSIELKDQFLSLVTHELKTPLTIINSAIQTLEIVYRDELTEKVRHYLDKIQQNSNRQLRLVENILDNTKLSEGHFTINRTNIDIVYLTQSIVNAVATFAEQKSIRVSFHSAFSKRIISIDWAQYERILLNLLSNAIKFTPPDKNITVRIYPTEKNICVEVRDEGIGIPEDRSHMIFSRFGQANSTLSRNAEGTGIGLSLVKLLAERLDGRIEFESEEGKGSTFTLTLPDRTEGEVQYDRILAEGVIDHLILKAKVEFSDIYF